MRARVFARFGRPLTNAAILLFVGLAFSVAAEAEISVLRPSQTGLSWLFLATAIASAGCLVLASILIDSNRISPHSFYRDRLADAYLKTDARTRRARGDDRQGMLLRTLRNDEDLKLTDIGSQGNLPPYHLVVTALNLQGSKELNRKTFLSEHFVFSKNYVGCRITGWVPTAEYHGGETGLARAMTISAAAAGSAMGVYSFPGQAFVMTLLNLRLGYWMDNPWIYRHGPPTRRGYWTFWLKYLWLELAGRAGARDRMVNLSDGGHTGDNLGLLPLLRRRLRTIIACDAEADRDYDFGSFNNAVRMAYIEENIEIRIDLAPIVRRRDTGLGYLVSEASIARGTILYPAGPNGEPGMEGELIYVKASVSGSSPVDVTSYLRDNPAFPHQSTGDQFFDDAQFEAYRCLGAHIAEGLEAPDGWET